MPNAGAPRCKQIALTLAWPAEPRRPHEDEMDDEAGEQIQLAFDKSPHALWQTQHVRHVAKQIRQPHSGAKRAARQTFL